ncbi:MAG TPA: CU044_2847 family protein [Mycobacteriales bacterium]|nr:CU044_2847 family protein [Mycobacteriales bacterium]
MTDPGFTISVSQNKYLARQAREMHAVLTVTSAGLGHRPGPNTAGPEAAEVILVDCSGSMDYPAESMDSPPSKISAARRATRAAIDVLRDGVLFAVVAGTDRADLVYPNEPRLVPASAATRADAKVAVGRLKANGGTAIGTWLTMADQLLGRHATAIRHAMLFTDGHNDHESPEELGRAVTDLARFELADGGSVVVEVEEAPGISRVSRQGRIFEAAGESFDQALTQVRDAASTALRQFQTMSRRPDEVVLKFGVKLDAEVGAMIAKTTLEGNLEVTLTWWAERSADIPEQASWHDTENGPPTRGGADGVGSQR